MKPSLIYRQRIVSSSLIRSTILGALLLSTIVACTPNESEPETSSAQNTTPPKTAEPAAKPTSSELIAGSWDITSEIDQGVASAMRKIAKSDEDYDNQINAMKLAFSLMHGKQTFDVDGSFQRQTKVESQGKWVIEQNGSLEYLTLTLDDGLKEQKKIIFKSDDEFYLELVGGKLIFKRAKTESK